MYPYYVHVNYMLSHHCRGCKIPKSLRKKVMLYKELQSPCNDEVVVYELFKYSAVTQETGAGVSCESM